MADSLTDLSPHKTHLRLNLVTTAAILSALIGGAFGAGQIFSGIKSDLAVHKADALVHLDPQFIFKHGVPVGAWDMDASVKALSSSISALQEQQKELQEWKASADAAREARRPRWRP